MIWDAHKISDRAYHRRRLIGAIAIGLLAIGLLVTRLQSFSGEDVNVWDYISAILWLGFLLYAVVMGITEYRAMQTSAENE